MGDVRVAVGDSGPRPGQDAGPVPTAVRPAGGRPAGAARHRGRHRRTAPRPDGSRRSELAHGARVAVVVALLGLPVGVLWWLLAPRVRVVRSAQGLAFADPQTKAFIGADGVFLLLTLVVGLACGAALHVWPRQRLGPATAVGLAAGSLAGAVLAWQVGYRLSHPGLERFAARHQVGQAGTLFLDLHARGVLLGWAVAGLLALVVAVAVGRPPDAGKAPAPREEARAASGSN